MTDNIAINNEAIYRNSVAQLVELGKGLDAEAAKADDVVRAVASAATSKDVANGQATASGATVAPAYAGTVSALEGVVAAIRKKAQDTAAAVAQSTADLTAMVDGHMQITATGADAINGA